MKRSLIAIVVLGVFLLSGCATYHISKQSLAEQLAGTRIEKKLVVNGNDLRTINVLDSKGRNTVLDVTRSTGVKITKTNGKHTTVYFDTILLDDSTISGCKTHFLNSRIKPVKLSEISKIELQK